MVNVITRFLSKENYRILAAYSGREAITTLTDDRPALDLLITDVAMPEMTGPQLADRVRQLYPGVPVLFQTGFAVRFLTERHALGDGTAVIEKPFTARGLMEAARLVQFGTLTPRE